MFYSVNYTRISCGKAYSGNKNTWTGEKIWLNYYPITTLIHTEQIVFFFAGKQWKWGACCLYKRLQTNECYYMWKKGKEGIHLSWRGCVFFQRMKKWYFLSFQICRRTNVCLLTLIYLVQLWKTLQWQRKINVSHYIQFYQFIEVILKMTGEEKKSRCDAFVS